MLSKWTAPLPRKWLQFVNQPASDAKLGNNDVQKPLA